jgi:uncharacterized protein (DUF2461 family)
MADDLRAAFDYLRALEAHNDREWYAAHAGTRPIILARST